jgi:hypothetical protein
VSREVLKVAAGDHEALSLLESPCRAVGCPIEAGANRPEGWGTMCAKRHGTSGSNR